ncbi:MAG TPA: lipoprotein insertase outer membrane protein LolB [Stenotrophomonas sp.]|nr:lipoprotein insertase outer membrane protein LolB [Stenotrophomonas sp.]
MNSSCRVLLLLAAALLSACASTGPRPAAPAAALPVSAQARQIEAERQAWLRAHPDWSFQGRAAISKGRNGGSGRVDWRQTGREYRIQLSAPVTRQSWVLSGDGATGQARLEGVDGGPRAGNDAQEVLYQATGWQIPVEGLPAWVRGLVDDGQPGVLLDGEGRPAALEQDGWQVQYQEWFPPQDGRPALPKRIEARNGDAKVRLLLDAWSADAP